MSIINAFLIAVSMYSRIPVPRVEWSEKNMQYAICFFPFVGIIEAVIYAVVLSIMTLSGFDIILKAALLTALPIIITGGIHMDGFLDTVDALSSCAKREKKLEIMKDPHSGAFAVIWGITYMVLYFGAMTEALKTEKIVKIICMGFIFSRILSGISVVSLKDAKSEGLLYTFSTMSHKRGAFTALIVELITISAAIIILGRGMGAAVLCAAAAAYICYKYISYKNFGGITGDTAGFFLQICELLILYVSVIFTAIAQS